MNWQFTPIVIPTIAVSLTAVYLTLYCWRQEAKGAKPLAILIFLAGLWSFGYAMELGATTLEGIYFWAKIEYLSIATVSLAWFIFALYFSNFNTWLTRQNVILLALVPALTIILMFTTEYHGLMWQTAWLTQSGPFTTVETIYGPWFWVHTAYSYVLLIAGTLILTRMLLRPSNLFRFQAAMIFVGAFIPIVANGLYVFGFSPWGNIDPTPYAFVLSGVTFTLALFKFRLLDITPVARRNVVELMADGVVVLDTKSRVVDINPAAQRIFQTTSAQAVGKDFHLLHHWPELDQHLKQADEVQTELDFISSDKQHYFDVHLSPLYGPRQQLSGYIIVLRDITARKQTEAALAKAHNQALQASYLKSQLLAKVSHELRTPLGAILGYAELLHEQAYGPINAKQKEITAEVIDSAQYLATLVNELLDEAQFEKGTIKLINEIFSVQSLLEQVENKMRVLAQKKGLSLTVTIAPETPPALIGDEYRLRQILLNLVGNGIKFTENGGVNICFFCPRSDCWAIQVSDTGPGIPLEAQSFIFESFRQVDGSETRRYQGAGLGLSIVKQLVDLMGGEISLESEPDCGSVFTVQFPLKTPQEQTL